MTRSVDEHESAGPRRLVAVIAVAILGTLIVWYQSQQPDPDAGADQEAKVDVPPATETSGVIPAEMGPDWQQLDDPLADGWESERFSQQAQQVVNRLGKLIEQTDPITVGDLRPLLTNRFALEPLRTSRVETAYEDDVFRVSRSVPPGTSTDSNAAVNAAQVNGDRQTDAAAEPNQGASGMLDQLQQMLQPLVAEREKHVKFKTIGVTLENGEPRTRHLFSLSGWTASGPLELHATWEIHWQATADRPTPRMSKLQVSQLEQVTTTGLEQTLFADCARSVLEANDCYEPQLLRGMNHWLGRSQDLRYFFSFGNPGLAVADVNGDGFDDLYLSQEEGLPNRLFLQNPDGTARDVSAEWQVDWLHNSRGVLLLDFDNDGDQDLACAMVGTIVFAENTGERFEIRATAPVDDDTMSLAAADYDLDGDLDVYACCYFERASVDDRGRPAQLLGAAESESGQGGGRNTLLQNQLADGDPWTFKDVTSDAGLDQLNGRFSFAASWEDFDNDGDPDLYVANDYGRNNLYRNDAGEFHDVADQTGGNDVAFGMSVAWGDYNQDGLLDAYIGNMFSSAGHRITSQDQFLKSSPELRPRFQRFARGNTLLRNRGDASFEDVSEVAGVTIGRWAWSSNFADINNDGRQDLLVANGFITTEDTGDL